MRFSLFLLMFFAAYFANAQDFGRGKSLNIPPVSTPTSTPPPISPSITAPNVLDNTTKSEDIKTTELNTKFGKPSEFADPNKRYVERMEQIDLPGDEVTNAKRDQYLGEIKTKSVVARIQCRDYDAIDGDIVRVYVNDVVIMKAIVLQGEFFGFDITLKEGTNQVGFEALNEGEGSPNTAEFHIYDDKGEVIYSNRWLMATGYRALVNIIRN